jgi:DNA-binding CsgD family transcriptional regulator
MLEMTALLDAARLGAASTAAPRLGQLEHLIEGPYAVAAARFARAAADQDGAGLDAAAGLFAAMGARLHAAEAAAAAVEVHGADGQYRRQAASWAVAQDLARHCEGAATPLLARLDQEPLVRDLTEREQEVAELAARGLTSQEIAETLVISLRTVHSHLNHTYTKLGISGRNELAAALGHRTARRGQPATERTRSTTT